MCSCMMPGRLPVPTPLRTWMQLMLLLEFFSHLLPSSCCPKPRAVDTYCRLSTRLWVLKLRVSIGNTAADSHANHVIQLHGLHGLLQVLNGQCAAVILRGPETIALQASSSSVLASGVPQMSLDSWSGRLFEASASTFPKWCALTISNPRSMAARSSSSSS